MPRPGPRPYECVRRAWHSDRHQPVRGSMVQQIFRLVNEAHNSATKKNKEWQEKLPIVVLRAEEIMYSKANSEEEYINLATLWDRVNDAINIIIRRDESAETGELLPPCVEAALNLGCTAVRTSRSQRHSNPRTYLSPRGQEPASGHATGIADPCSNLLPRQSGVSASSSSNKHANPSPNLLLAENIPAERNLMMQTNHQLNLGSSYPLYYGTEYQRNEAQCNKDTPARACSDTIFVGEPIGTSAPETGFFPCFYSNTAAENAASRNTERTAHSSQNMSHKRQCDLSLKLSLFAHPCVNGESNSASETKDIWSTDSEGADFNHLSPQIDRQLYLYPISTSYNPFSSGSTAWHLEVENKNLGQSFRKRKAPLW